MGNLLSVFIHAVNIHDTTSGIVPAHSACLKYPTIQRFYADAEYILRRGVDISEKSKPHKWEKLEAVFIRKNVSIIGIYEIFSRYIPIFRVIFHNPY